MINAFLDEYLKENGLTRFDDRVRFVQFSNRHVDVQEDLDALLSGEKTAMFRIKEWLLCQGLVPAQKDEILVISDYYGVPKSVVKVLKTETVRFGDITEEMTKAMAVGDGSVEAFKHCRSKLIKENCDTINIDFNDDLEIIIYWFEIIFPPK